MLVRLDGTTMRLITPLCSHSNGAHLLSIVRQTAGSVAETANSDMKCRFGGVAFHCCPYDNLFILHFLQPLVVVFAVTYYFS
ncbi:hypothetical protein J6590_000042 [Homalodisca vitripennis]|nr:hypothetical protein J6590_000042 [Homalodisca vitripennis]